MAFGKGNVSTEGTEIKRYTGIASVFVKGVNFNKAELEKFYGREIENEPTYISETDGVKQVRLDFFVEADPASVLHPEIEFKSKISFFLRNAPRLNRDNTKKQIIDKYGRTAWATEDEINAKQIPVYSNGKPANIDKDYRVAYDGEEQLIQFLIAYLSIDSVQKYNQDTKEWSLISNDPNVLADCEAGLDNIDKYFSGNVNELKDVLKIQPNNKLKALFGVKTTENGQYQDVYTRMFLKNKATTYTSLEKNLASAKENGAYPNTEFEVSPLHEYVINPTNFGAAPVETDNPWD